MTDVVYYYICDLGRLARTEDGYPYRLTVEGQWVHDVHVGDRLHDYGDYSRAELDRLTPEEAMEQMKKIYGFNDDQIRKIMKY